MRYVIILFALIGCFFALRIFLPSSAHTAFTIGQTGIPWFVLGMCGIGIAAFKLTK